MAFQYEIHVKIVGIVEIILQVLWSLVVFALVMLLIFGASMLSSYGSSTSYISDYRTPLANDAASAVSGFLIAIIVILVLIVAFNAWLVHLVFTGGQTRHASRLTIWYIIQSILLSLSILTQITAMFLGNPWYFIVLGLIFDIYRIYAIHVVRCFVAEITPRFQTSA